MTASYFAVKTRGKRTGTGKDTPKLARYDKKVPLPAAAAKKRLLVRASCKAHSSRPSSEVRIERPSPAPNKTRVGKKQRLSRSSSVPELWRVQEGSEFRGQDKPLGTNRDKALRSEDDHPVRSGIGGA